MCKMLIFQEPEKCPSLFTRYSIDFERKRFKNRNHTQVDDALLIYSRHINQLRTDHGVDRIRNTLPWHSSIKNSLGPAKSELIAV